MLRDVEVAQSFFKFLDNRVFHEFSKNYPSDINRRLRFYFTILKMPKALHHFFIDLISLLLFHKHVVSFAEVLYKKLILLISQRLAHLNDQLANKNVEKEPHKSECVGKAIRRNLSLKRRVRNHKSV